MILLEYLAPQEHYVCFFCLQLDNIHSEDMSKSLVMKESKLPKQQNIEVFLQLLGISFQDEQLILSDQRQNQDLLLATHILLSAVAGTERAF